MLVSCSCAAFSSTTTRHSSKPRAVFLTRTGSGSPARHQPLARRCCLASELQPDVILVDIALGDENGFDLARRLAEVDARDLAVIMISSDTADDYADLVAESPALGFLPKAELSADGIRQLLGKVR